MIYYINGIPYSSLTPSIDRIKKLNGQLNITEDDIHDIPNPSPFDEYFLGVAEKHGINMFEETEDSCEEGDIYE
jgi:hypothetical protein